MKRVIIYCRESRDEGGLDFARIETQRDILLRFVARRGIIGEIEVILDDNVSGTDFSRLEGIACRAEAGEISALVFKDASRLGRNLRESLNFLHRMDNCGVEVLFESEAYDPELFPLLAWFNERRAGEDSRKVRRVLRHLMQTGDLIIRAPYGYKKIASRLEIDRLAAGIVRRIFSMYLAGCSTGEIAGVLNNENIPTPSSHPGRESHRRTMRWNRQHVRRIISDRAYTGDMCCSKTEKPSFKSKKVLRKPPEQWLILENHHEAIISREIFRGAQQIAARAQKSGDAPEKLAFTGIIYCGGCGGRLVQRRRQGRADAYVCAAYRRSGKKACSSHYIREDTLHGMVRAIIEPTLSKPDFAARLCLKLASESAPHTEAEKQAKAYERAVMRIYSDMIEHPGQLPRELYEKKLAEYTARLTAVKAALAAAGSEATDLQAVTRFLSEVPLYCRRELIHRLFERVIFYLPDESGADSGERGHVTFILRKLNAFR